MRIIEQRIELSPADVSTLSRHVLGGDSTRPEERLDRSKDEPLPIGPYQVNLEPMLLRPALCLDHDWELDGRRDNKVISLKGNCDECLKGLHGQTNLVTGSAVASCDRGRFVSGVAGQRRRKRDEIQAASRNRP